MEYVACSRDYEACHNSTSFSSTLRNSLENNDYVVINQRLNHQILNDDMLVQESSII